MTRPRKAAARLTLPRLLAGLWLGACTTAVPEPPEVPAPASRVTTASESAARASAPHEGAVREELVIALVGDVMVGRGFNWQLAAAPDVPIWRGFESALADVDIFAFNLETTISDWDGKWPNKVFNFQLLPRFRDLAFRSLPIPAHSARVASIANNHVLDFEVEGLRETRANLEKLGFHVAGAGENATQAQTPAIIDTASGLRVAFLAAADHCSCNHPSHWSAGPDEAGMWYLNPRPGGVPTGVDAAIEAVRALRPQVDVLVFSLHWGPNYSDEPPPRWMRAFAKRLVAAGVDVIHGHSSHHILPVETIDGKTVLYGLGDFVDDYVVRERYRSDLGLLAKIHVSRTGEQRLELLPTRIGHEGVSYVELLAPGDPDGLLALARARGANSR